jgi:bacterioferritin-associated ferredoxin
MYVCVCNAVTEKDIRKAVDRGASSLFDVQNELPVGICCGRCGDTAEAVIRECLAKACNDSKKSSYEPLRLIPQLA